MFLLVACSVPCSGPVVKFVDREILMQERERELALKAEKERKKKEAAEKRAREEAEKREKARTRPQDLFKDSPDYSQFDERGIPTHDKGQYRNCAVMWCGVVWCGVVWCGVV